MGRTASSFLSDFLQSYPFWLFDVAPIDQFGLPLFTPLFGFSRITSPEMTARVKIIKEGNWHFDRKVISGAKVSPVTMERGVFWLDSDFWRWTQAAIFGDPDLFDILGGVNVFGIPGPTIRRDLLLIHFFSRGPVGGDRDDARAVNFAIGAGGTAALGLLVAGTSASLGNIAPALGTTALGVGGFAAVNQLSPGSTFRIPAKAWLLEGCLPTRYKVASDFDALSSAISIQELDIEYERFEEISLAG